MGSAQRFERGHATLIRLLGDLDIAGGARHEAFRATLEQWPHEGTPANSRACYVSAGRFKAIDILRSHARVHKALVELVDHIDRDARDDVGRDDDSIKDDRLR